MDLNSLSASAGLLAISATILNDPMSVSSQESPQPKLPQNQNQSEIESATCECCGLTEDCTLAYIERIRERYLGRWICGLCGEAIKDEIVRSKRLISTEEAMAKHMSFFNAFKSPPDPAVHFISAMRQILRRSLDSPRGLRSTPTSPSAKIVDASTLARSESCFSTLSS